MKISLAKNAGHCFGVKAAIQKAFATVRQERQPVFTLGPIIHNPQVVRSLEKEGVKAVKNLSEIPKGVIIIRSHGVSPQIIAAAQARGLKVVDATCPFVQRAQQLARQLVEKGYDLIVLGDSDHPEVEGIIGTVQGRAIVVSGAEQIPNLPEKKSYGLIAQTTQALENLQQVASALLTRTRTLKVLNTICNATTDLQKQTRLLAQSVDLMLVVGGRNSANTTRLAVICQENGVPVHHIETVDEIQPDWLRGVKHVGVTAGTSTPEEVIKEIMERLKVMADAG
ncbi:4-hydroxy-3-methylbut-2-enyl diphosphate reductase [bacterium]|nr:4-hydroxy-3-methylbut-2-enyl diphosphate reductase [bacterium]